ncbi:CBS domain-containing protein [Shewanella sp. 202IG2-18]|uniref:CBS domain-containing protein n=1 Tax=Parashewanella hymeniacidonis TaxID=2807618 RepID=UPI00195FA396|nr:CBS domain-containing protein [Parashewanella hymeniacidonis]MBM7071340.1 CBS domain-containing protein [Parashewanella hymeniacidonis]
MKELIVQDYMQPTFPTIHAETEITEAILKLKDYSLISAPVLDRNKKPVGYLSEHELLKPLLHASYHCDSNLRVSDVMRHDTLTVNANTSLLNLAEMMLGAKPKNYPVINEQGQVIGIITRSHVLTALMTAYNDCQQV